MSRNANKTEWFASVFYGMAVEEIQGFDGAWVNQDLLVIPREFFKVTDLNEPISFPKKFDLAISLEVAEHLPPEFAGRFVDSLTGLSDVILFSAAIPQQGGRNHFNEQWPDYWARLFQSRGYAVLDVLRTRIWGDPDIPYWYRQNVLLFVRKELVNGQLRASLETGGALPEMPLSLVHPELYAHKNAETLSAGWKHFRRSIKSSIRRIF